MAAWLYIMTNRRDGTLYIGVTTAIAARAWQHKTGAVPGFTKKHGLTRLVYVETHDTINAAIRRERPLKTWRRAWKVRLITEINPNWDDLYDQLLA
jgi:putative endonuclease